MDLSALSVLQTDGKSGHFKCYCRLSKTLIGRKNHRDVKKALKQGISVKFVKKVRCTSKLREFERIVGKSWPNNSNNCYHSLLNHCRIISNSCYYDTML